VSLHTVNVIGASQLICASGDEGKIGVTEEEGVVDVASEEDSESDDDLQAQRFEFEKYEAVSVKSTCVELGLLIQRL
jgi:replication fork protection complex subunit Tof1/Swi1